MKNLAVCSRVLVLIASIAVAACGPADEKPVVDTTRSRPAMGGGHQTPTCGPVGPGRDSAIADGSFPAEAISWETWNIPEFQDKQRFVTGRGTRYGPIACVVAAEKLSERKNSPETPDSLTLVAVIYVDSTGPLTPAYTRLNLNYRFNCVLLQRAPGTTSSTSALRALGGASGKTSTAWAAHIVRSENKRCAPVTDGSRLDVVSLAEDGVGGSAYPGVARFVILDNWMPAVGVRCGMAWCTIGAQLARLTIPAHVNSIPTNDPGRHKRVIPGWYDEQQLAAPRAGKLKASLRASIVPDDGLDGYTITTDFDTGFVNVATIHFEDEPTDKYVTVWGFTRGRVKENVLSLKHITGAQWEARVDGVPRALKVKRTDHSGTHITGTARWAWSELDESIWVRCEDGCCLVEPLTAGTTTVRLDRAPPKASRSTARIASSAGNLPRQMPGIAPK